MENVPSSSVYFYFYTKLYLSVAASLCNLSQISSRWRFHLAMEKKEVGWFLPEIFIQMNYGPTSGNYTFNLHCHVFGAVVCLPFVVLT